MTAFDDMPHFDFERLLAEERVCIHFQPIVSMRRECVLIGEALSRGVLPDSEELIAPEVLFTCAKKCGKVLELDRLCRKKALEAFRCVGADARDLILSVNFESSILDQGVLGSNHFLNAVEAAGLSPDRIVLEIVESSLDDVEPLRIFTERHRAEGFLIALDDFGAGHSNFDRIHLLKPDILKIDHSLIEGMSAQYHKREVVKSLVGMAHQIGAIAIAEGIENEEDLLAAQKAGIDMFQGFFFAQPAAWGKDGLRCDLGAMAAASKALREATNRDIAARRDLCAEYCAIQDEYIERLAESTAGSFDGVLRTFVRDELALEAIYVANFDGVLVTDTHVQDQVLGHNRSLLVTPAPRGTDLSSKPYCAGVRAGMERFISEPYISQASGDICITLSRPFDAADGQRFILCCDIAFSGPDVE